MCVYIYIYIYIYKCREDLPAGTRERPSKQHDASGSVAVGDGMCKLVDSMQFPRRATRAARRASGPAPPGRDRAGWQVQSHSNLECVLLVFSPSSLLIHGLSGNFMVFFSSAV